MALKNEQPVLRTSKNSCSIFISQISIPYAQKLLTPDIYTTFIFSPAATDITFTGAGTVLYICPLHLLDNWHTVKHYWWNLLLYF